MDQDIRVEGESGIPATEYEPILDATVGTAVGRDVDVRDLDPGD